MGNSPFLCCCENSKVLLKLAWSVIKKASNPFRFCHFHIFFCELSPSWLSSVWAWELTRMVSGELFIMVLLDKGIKRRRTKIEKPIPANKRKLPKKLPNFFFRGSHEGNLKTRIRVYKLYNPKTQKK